jgi:CRISPR system Cascade subunit CasC
MTQFLQLHMLTSYPPACLNRDDLNRPKTAVVGGIPRLRISSQSLKRAWRTSESFQSSLTGHLGTRTKRLGIEVYEQLRAAEVREKEAKEWARSIAGCFGALKSAKKDKELNELEIEQLAHVSPEEREAVRELTGKLAAEKRAPLPSDLELLRANRKAVDIAMFGRMLADSPKFNVEAATQVAHASTVHRAAVEDDYFTAVDDLNARDEDTGSAHIGEQGFGAGLFYNYVCIDCDRLIENVSGDRDLAQRAVGAFLDAAAMVAPTGKQNSFGSRAWAYYVLAEKGERQPRSLSLAFVRPVREGDMLNDAIVALTNMRDNLDRVYYDGKALPSRNINACTGEGSFTELKAWASTQGAE